MNTGIAALELAVGIFISFTLLLLFIKAIKQGQFDDSKKQMGGLLFDSVQDLQDAQKKEQKMKKMKEDMKVKKDSDIKKA